MPITGFEIMGVNMRNFLKSGILAAAAAIVMPAAASQGQAPEWWLVLDSGDARSAHFVDLASMAEAGGTIRVSALTLDRNGHRKTGTLNVDCNRGSEIAVTNFICGSEEYRSGNGLILGPVSPDEMAKTLFATQPASAAAWGFHEA